MDGLATVKLQLSGTRRVVLAERQALETALTAANAIPANRNLSEAVRDCSKDVFVHHIRSVLQYAELKKGDVLYTPLNYICVEKVGDADSTGVKTAILPTLAGTKETLTKMMQQYEKKDSSTVRMLDFLVSVINK